MAKKKTAKKEEPVTADVELVEEYDATRYTPWVPGNMPVGGKSNSTEQLDDHPTEHNHSAEAISDIVDRFADLRFYVPAANSCGVDGDLQVNGQYTGYNGNPSVPTYSFWNDRTLGLYLVAVGMVGVSGDLQVDKQYTGFNGTRSVPTYSFWNDRTLGLYLVAAGKMAVSGGLQVDGQIYAQDGSTAAPGYSFNNNTKTGIHYTGPGNWASSAVVSISANGTEAANFGDKGCSIPPVYTNTVPDRANVFVDKDGALHRSTAAVFDIEESDYNELVEKVAALTAQIETLMDRVESLERLTPITADA